MKTNQGLKPNKILQRKKSFRTNFCIGHADVIMGGIATNRNDLYSRLKYLQNGNKPKTFHLNFANLKFWSSSGNHSFSPGLFPGAAWLANAGGSHGEARKERHESGSLSRIASDGAKGASCWPALTSAAWAGEETKQRLQRNGLVFHPRQFGGSSRVLKKRQALHAGCELGLSREPNWIAGSYVTRLGAARTSESDWSGRHSHPLICRHREPRRFNQWFKQSTGEGGCCLREAQQGWKERHLNFNYQKTHCK